MTSLSSGTLMQASHQWATRPDDERFTSLPDMYNASKAMRERSKSAVISSRRLQAAPVENDSRALVAVGPDGNTANFSNWSFGQLAQLAGAPAAYMRNLPGELAADCLNYGLQTRDVEDIGVLLYRNGSPQLRAVTGPNYGRVWNHQVIGALIERFGDGVTGDFKVPGEFGHDVEITKANTTLYASDRDMFVFLADEKHRIEIPGRRDGQAMPWRAVSSYGIRRSVRLHSESVPSYLTTCAAIALCGVRSSIVRSASTTLPRHRIDGLRRPYLRSRRMPTAARRRSRTQ